MLVLHSGQAEDVQVEVLGGNYVVLAENLAGSKATKASEVGGT